MNKCIQFLIISDIHSSDIRVDAIMSKFSQIGELVASQSLNVTDLIVVLPGDIVQSGKENEFVDFLSIFELMKENIQEQRPHIKFSVVCVPGNHDVDISINSTACKYCHKTSQYEGDAIDVFLERQTNFFNFYREMTSRELDTKERICWHERIETREGHTIRFSMINSACFIDLDQHAETLYYPCSEFNKDGVDGCCDLTITLLHHPLSWFQTKIKTDLRKKIENNSDIIITGHCHDGDSYQKHKGEATSYYIESPVFHDPCSEMKEEIRSVYLAWTDSYKAQLDEYAYCWLEGNFLLIPESHSTQILYTKHIENGFAFSQEHGKWLNALPIAQMHPSGRNIEIDDIFVYPRLQRIQGKKRSSLENTINSENIISDVIPVRCLIHGESQSGKTMLAKQYIKELRKQGKTPIYLNFADVGNRDIIAFVDSEYKRQYSTRNREEAFRIQPSELALIIDNFDNFVRKVKNKADLLISLTKKCDTLIVFASDISSSAYLLNTDICKLHDSDFKIYKILEFNHTAKYQLLSKWNSLNDASNNEEQINQLITEQEKSMNALLGKSLVPKYPIYILLFLQAMSQSASVSEAEIGTYGSLYEIVIKKQLASVITKKFNFQTLSNYLCEFAFYMYRSEKMRLNEREYEAFAASFNDKYQTLFNTYNILDVLVDSGIISKQRQREYNEYYFAHNYSFYYFIARYLNSNRDNDGIIEEIAKLCNDFQNEKRANIWLFLTHLSSDKKIINILLNHAKNLFNEQKEIKFEDDISFSERLDLQVKFDDDTHTNLTKRRLIAADTQELERHESDEEEYPRGEEEDESASIQNKLLSAAKTIDILGQLLRNFTGRLDGDTKRELLQETYNLTFRVINFFIETYQIKSEELINYIKAKLGDENEELTRKQIIPDLLSFVYSILQILTFNIFHRTAVAVSHPDLIRPYENLRKSMPQTNAFYLLQSFVKLNAEKSLKTFMGDEEFIQLKKKLFCMGLIRLEVVNFCYMYPIDFPEKQSACSKYGIQYRNLHISEQLRKLT